MNRTLYEDEQQNAIRISSIQKLNCELPFRGFAAKFVTEGCETYHIRQQSYLVKKGEYILGNKDTIAEICIHSPQAVDGLCIDISENIIAEVADYQLEAPKDLKNFLLTDDFFINKYRSEGTCLGYALRDMHLAIKNGVFRVANEELFYALAECIIADQQVVFEQYSKLSFKRQDTGEHLFRQLLEAKDFIHEHFLEDIHLDQIAIQCGISKYHFIRLFKNTFQLSPYQYILRKRLEFAKSELLKGKPIVEIATTSGFADTASFSKAFKQHFGQAPSNLKK